LFYAFRYNVKRVSNNPKRNEICISHRSSLEIRKYYDLRKSGKRLIMAELATT